MGNKLLPDRSESITGHGASLPQLTGPANAGALRQILFSSMVEIGSNVRIDPGFKYGTASFARDGTIEGLPDRVVCGLVRRPFDSREIQTSSETVFFYGIRGDPGRGDVLLVREVGKRLAVLVLSSISDGTPRVSFNRLYDVWSDVRYAQVNPPIKHLESLVETSLLRRSITPVHCGCVLCGGYAHLIVAPPDTGKSYSVMQLVRDGLEYGAEDLVLVRGKEVYPVPFTTSVAKRSSRLAWQERLVGLASKRYGAGTHKQTVYESLGIPYKPMAPSYRLGNIYILQRSSSSSLRRMSSPDRSGFNRRLLMWNRMELGYHRDRMLMALLTLNADLPTLDDLMAAERTELESMVRYAQDFFLVEADHPKEFPRLIMESLN